MAEPGGEEWAKIQEHQSQHATDKSLADKHTWNNLNSACYYYHNWQINLIFHGEILSYGSWGKVMGR